MPVTPGFTSFDPAVVGYRPSEVLLSETASAYEPKAPPGWHRYASGWSTEVECATEHDDHLGVLALCHGGVGDDL